ncbi:MAG: VOC family protein [Alphaproteobacteria bacterium]|nr:VOC family protein [Alphaproteobacteria bacterium]MBV9371810.1 VOC family protein [Alphaproteobacteria bacterium]MBV9901905.1 VOC family protein [Alphaproteobacteria bacterium]
MPSIATCLWFDKQAEEAANFYVSLFPDSRIDKIDRSPADYPNGKAGDVLVVEFTLGGRPFIALNGGPEFTFDEAISMSVSVEGQAETDRYWEALTADGGQPSVCGWLKDRYGLSWQIVPKELTRLLSDSDRDRAKRAMEAMMKMGKIDIAELQRAADAA